MEKKSWVLPRTRLAGEILGQLCVLRLSQVAPEVCIVVKSIETGFFLIDTAYDKF